MNRPWYLVPGRKDLTERRLHRRREIEARHNETWNQINKYFNSCSVRCKQFSEWSKLKPTSRVFTLPPYDCDITDKQEKVSVDPRKMQEAEIMLRDLIEGITNVEEEAECLRTAGDEMVAQISFLKQLMSDANIKKSSWMIKSKRIRYVRFSRDKLRHELFLSFDKLSYFRTILSNVGLSQSLEKILTDDVSNEIRAVIQTAVNIIETFIDLNRQRNYDIVNMFQEEADQYFEEYQEAWYNEDSICWQLILRILDAFEFVLKEKLDQNVREQESLLLKKTEKCRRLSSFINDIKSDELLWEVMATKIN